MPRSITPKIEPISHSEELFSLSNGVINSDFSSLQYRIIASEWAFIEFNSWAW